MTATIPYLITKARAHSGTIPSLRKVKTMIDSPTVSVIETLLSSHEFYNEILQKARPTVDIIMFESELRKQFAAMLNTYAQGASPKAKMMIKAFKYKIEAQNLQILYRALVGGDTDHQILNYVVPVEKFSMNNYARILNSTSLKSSIDFILYPELRKPINKAIETTKDDEELIFYIVSELEHAAYQFIYKENRKIKAEVELLNLETVARAISLEINPENWIIQGIGKVAQSIDDLKRFNSPHEVIRTMLNVLPFANHFADVLNAKDENIISLLERKVNLALIQVHKKNFRIFGLQKEALFSFFSLKLAETQDISKIIFGKSSSITKEKISQSLTYYQI